jgi:RNA polymerase sigma factor (sigma-70 family)
MEKYIYNTITEREKEVVSLMYKGFNYNEIANQMNISPGTVRKHTENIYKKLEVHNCIIRLINEKGEVQHQKIIIE